MVKPTVMKKTAGLLVTLLLLSALVPVLAFAAGLNYGNITYKDGKVSGTVYTDTYSLIQSVYVNVYDQNQSLIKSVYVNSYYDQTVDGVTYRYYKFDNVSVGVYSAVYLGSYYTQLNGSVLETVYSTTYSAAISHTTTPSGGCCYGGGPIGNTVNADGSIDVTNGQVSASALKDAFDKHTVVTLKLSGEKVEIPVEGLIDAIKKDGATLVIQSDSGTYELPLSAIDFEALAKELGVDVEDLTITVSISELTGDDAQEVTDAVYELGGEQLSAAVDFSITVEGNGKEISLDTFNQYVKRTVPLTKEASKTATVVLYNPQTGELSFVPALFSDSEAQFWRQGNSVYTVAECDKTFDDISDHWAKADIELLASKLIVDGVTDTEFQPDRNITRAEFAALVVRSLGLNSVSGATYFDDVKDGDWFAGVVGAAAQAGIVDGYEDGTFRPQAEITREELAAMVVRAYEFAGGEVAISESSIAQALSKWSDADKIVWGQREVALALVTGLMNGMTSTTLETDAQATRAQSATMLKRFLSEVEFID